MSVRRPQERLNYPYIPVMENTKSVFQREVISEQAGKM